MNNWDNPSKNNPIESSSEQYRGRIEVVKKLVTALNAESESYVDKFADIVLPEKGAVRVVLGLGDYLRNGAKNAKDFLRVYLQDGDKKIEWETLSKSEKFEILHIACPAGDIESILE